MAALLGNCEGFKNFISEAIAELDWGERGRFCFSRTRGVIILQKKKNTVFLIIAIVAVLAVPELSSADSPNDIIVFVNTAVSIDDINIDDLKNYFLKRKTRWKKGGKVIPVIDLRLRFAMGKAEHTDQTCIIVVEISRETETVLVGIVVDSVSEVLNIKGTDVEETPQFGSAVSTDFILGMAKMEGGVKILLDIDKVLNFEEIASLGKAA